MRFSLKLLALSSTILLTLPAHAALVVVNHDYDPANVQNAFVDGFAQENLAAPVTLGAGDTLDFTVTFGGNSITLFDANTYVWPLLFTADSDSLDVSGTFEFLGATGNLASGPIAVSQVNEMVHIGVGIFAANYRTGPGAVSFTGVRQILTINSSVNGLTRDFDRISVNADGLAAVPEPATWAMMMVGFGAAGAVVRRRTRTTFSFG